MPSRIGNFVASMNIQPTDRVLEIGCGHGVAADMICNMLNTGQYLAIDRSPKMIAAAEKKNRTHFLSGKASFILSDLESFDPGEQRFDKVFAMRVRLFHDQPEKARELVKRWLASNGQIFVEYDEPGKK